MTSQDFEAAASPKVNGTQNLYNATSDLEMEFFVMISSISGMLGFKGQANYAAGNSFQDYLALELEGARTPYISLILGLIEDSNVIKLHPERMPALIRTGCYPIKIQQALSLLEHTMVDALYLGKKKQIVSGFDRLSISSQDDLDTLKNPLFAALPYSVTKTVVREGSSNIEDQIQRAKNKDDLQRIIASGVSHKMAALLARSDVDVHRPLSDLGLDSLIAIELTNWITRHLKTSMLTSEVLDMPSIWVLSEKILEKSSLLRNRELIGKQTPKEESVNDDRQTRPYLVNPSLPKLPQLPLPDLGSSLQLFYQAVRPFCSDSELEATEAAIQKFLRPGSQGGQLQNRLLERTSQIDGWQYELYTRHVYLGSRSPINPYQHFANWFPPLGGHLPTQAEAAAAISLGAFNFRQNLQKGDIRTEFMNDQPLCMVSLQYLFGTTREPDIGVDTIQQYHTDYIVVLRNGHFFQVFLSSSEGILSYLELKETFRAILKESTTPILSLGTLTADDRDSWARVMHSTSLKITELTEASDSKKNNI
jgi:acyl carrier protein